MEVTIPMSRRVMNAPEIFRCPNKLDLSHLVAKRGRNTYDEERISCKNLPSPQSALN